MIQNLWKFKKRAHFNSLSLILPKIQFSITKSNLTDKIVKFTTCFFTSKYITNPKSSRFYIFFPPLLRKIMTNASNNKQCSSCSSSILDEHFMGNGFYLTIYTCVQTYACVLTVLTALRLCVYLCLRLCSVRNRLNIDRFARKHPRRMVLVDLLNSDVTLTQAWMNAFNCVDVFDW